jgi:HME family heavy-metal exporter
MSAVGRKRPACSKGIKLAAIITQIRAVLADQKIPEGYFVSLEGQFQAQEVASQLIAGLSLISLSLICRAVDHDQ